MPVDTGLAGAVYRANARVVIDDYAGWDDGAPEIRRLGFRHAAGFPIYIGGEIGAVLVGGVRGAGSVTGSQLECLELLASQAGAALANTRLLEKMWHQANHDGLTGLPNQKLLEDRAKQAISRAARAGSSVALLYLDVDRFKKINDSLGHEAGNQLLKQIGGRLVAGTRDADTVARLGGDEFVVLVPDLESEALATAVAEKVFGLFQAPFVVNGRELFVSVSMGLAVSPIDAATFDGLRKHADVAMYHGKRRGRNTLSRFAHDFTMAPAALDLEADLHHALRGDELFLVYQPQIDLRSNMPVAVEALVRWRHPTRGVLAPDAFLHLAEEAGLMEAVDRWVLGAVCEQIGVWKADGSVPRVAVNVSGATVQNEAAVIALGQILKERNVDPACVEFEVTETVTMEQGAAGARALAQLRVGGSHITIDDFGTGFSAFGRLRQFPVDKLKIDKSFVHEIGVRGGKSPSLQAIVAMAADLGLEVVAEGVETQQQATFLASLGCDLVQGYLYGMPSVATTDAMRWSA